jgi:uncharacterized protein involved in exopolysaccharide biosynthesis
MMPFDAKDALAAVGAVLGTMASAIAAVVWNKADKAVPKSEFMDFAKRTSDTMRDLFRNAEADRHTSRDLVSRMEERMADNHIEVLKELAKKADR